MNPSYGLNDAEVERILSDSFDHAESDFAARFLIEARTEADGLLRATRKSLTKGRDTIPQEERTEIALALQALEKSLASTDYREIPSMHRGFE